VLAGRKTLLNPMRRAFPVDGPIDFQCCDRSTVWSFSQQGYLHAAFKDTSSRAINTFSSLEV